MENIPPQCCTGRKTPSAFMVKGQNLQNPKSIDLESICCKSKQLHASCKDLMVTYVSQSTLIEF